MERVSPVRRTAKKKPPLFTVFALLGVIAVCLVVLLLVIRDERSDAGAGRTMEAEAGDRIEGSDGEGPEIGYVTGTSGGAESTATGETAIEEAVEETEIYIIIDDVGNNLDQLDQFLGFPGTLTFAVMPQRPFSIEAVRRISESGHDVIVHQPMEAVGGQNPGPGAIYTSMSEEEIRKTLDANLEGLEQAVGMNNHMGSRVTSDADTMRSILTYLKEREMFFLDSVTTEHSVAGVIAEEIGLGFARRSSAFLDNDREMEAIAALLERGLRGATETGDAILIGHVHSHALADILKRNYQRLFDRGYRFLGLNGRMEQRPGE